MPYSNEILNYIDVLMNP